MPSEANRFSQELFVSYAEEDSIWVKGYLLPSLGITKSQILTQEGFQLGQPLANEFERAISTSRFILLVISPAYMMSHWTLFGEALATFVSIENHAARLIPLILSEVDLPLRLKYKVQLNCTVQEQWADSIQKLRESLGQPELELEEITCPYPGMLPYSSSNATQYFGREKLINNTIESLRVQKLMTIIGPSGSGKTSFLSAGVLSQLPQSKLFPGIKWHVLSMRPGPQPLHKLAVLLGQHLSKDNTQILDELRKDAASLLRHLDQISPPTQTKDYWVLIIDQFEEVFVQCKQPDECQKFFESLRVVFAAIPERWRCFLSVRADFYADCQESILWEDIEASLLNLPPLTRDELKRAIVEPAKSVDVYLESSLVERLLDDTEGQKGPLPLLQETLVLMWSRYLHSHLLTLDDYKTLGTSDLTGLEVALGKWADSSLAELRQDNQRAIARRIFLRLIEFGTGRNDTRRQQYLEDLFTQDDEKVAVQTVLEYLVEHRLVTMGYDETTGMPLVDLAHEKLIESWPQLRNWLEAYHTMESERRSLVLASTTWQENEQENSFLFTGKRLKKTIEWAKKWDQELNALDKEFLTASEEWDARIRRRQRIATFTVSIIVFLIISTIGFLGVREFVRQQTGSPVIRINEGTAILGSDNPEQIDHEITLLVFGIEEFEVNNHQYKACDEHGPCDPPLNRDDYDDRAKEHFPVVWITAKQANTYCQWLGRRLPTSVEWERAVRGTKGRLWPWGNEPVPDMDVELLSVLQPTDSIPETSTADDDPIYHLADNVSEWVVRVEPGCQGEECHLVWDGETDSIAYAGGAYDRYIERVTEITNSASTNPDLSIGFRCVEDVQP